MRQPVVCAINGGCVGIGLSMALACDLRFAAADAKVGVIFPQRGLIAEDGMGYYLPHLMVRHVFACCSCVFRACLFW